MTKKLELFTYNLISLKKNIWDIAWRNIKKEEIPAKNEDEEKNQFLFHYNLRYYNFIEICNCHDYSEKIIDSKYLCKYDYLELQKFLLEKENLNLTDNQIGKLINRAVLNGNTEMVKLLNKDISFQNITMHLSDEFYLFSRSYQCKYSSKYSIGVHTLTRPSIVFNRIVEKPSLYLAIEKQNSEIIKLLLESKKVDINRKMEIKTDEYSLVFEKIQMPPLYKAINIGNVRIFNLLLNDESIDVNSLYECDNNYYFTYRQEIALLIAVQFKNFEMVKLLLSKPNIDVNYRATYEYDVENGKEHLSNRDDTIQTIRKTALRIAIEKGYAQICKLFLAHPNIDVNAVYNFEKYIDRHQFFFEEKTGLHLAISKKYMEIVKLLLNHPKINVNAKIKTKAIKNVVNNNKGFLWEIVKKQEITKSTEKTALLLAVQKNNANIVKLLLEDKNINVNILNFTLFWQKSLKNIVFYTLILEIF